MTLVPSRRFAAPPAQRRAPVLERRRSVRSVCLSTCSFNPSGMGSHMLALAEQHVRAGLDVSLAFWPASPAEALPGAAEELGVRLLRTPHPRDPAYADDLTAVSRLQADSNTRIGVPPTAMTTIPSGVPPRGRGPGRSEARRRLGLGPA